MAGRRIARAFLGTPRRVTVRQDLLAGALGRCWGRTSCQDVLVMETRRTAAIEELQRGGGRINRAELFTVGRTARAFAQTQPIAPPPALLEELYARAPVRAPSVPMAPYVPPRNPKPPRQAPTPGEVRRGPGRPKKDRGVASPAAPAPAPASPAPQPEPRTATEQLAFEVIMKAARGETLANFDDNPALKTAVAKAGHLPEVLEILAHLPKEEPPKQPKPKAPPAPAGEAPAPGRTLSPEEVAGIKVSRPRSKADQLADLPPKVRRRSQG